MFNDAEGNFCAHKFIHYLETEGKKCLYNDSTTDFQLTLCLPPYYDEKKIKRAQQFFEENTMSMLTVSIAGLLVLLSDADGIGLLIATNKSTEPLAAYKRYRDTFFHMLTWYEDEFKPGSKLWKSLTTVRNMHNAAVKLGQKQGINGIEQGGLSMTLYGFFGLALARPKLFGLSSATTEDLEALVHFWRVIGYMMGVIEDLNICRESLDETKAICQAATDRIAVHLHKKHPDSVMLQFAVLDGSNMVIPSIDAKVFMNFITDMVATNQTRKEYYYPMNLEEKLQLMIFKSVLRLCQYKFLRRFFNFRLRYTIYLMQTYPEVVEHSIRDTDLLSLI